MRPCYALVAVLLAALPARAGGDAQDVFTTKVRPILARYCFKCHGPDDQVRKARLRLDLRDAATKPARSKRKAIVPGKPEQSELVARIFSTDETEVMPPPATKFVLSAEEKQTLKAWIATGAPYVQHWSFVPPHRPTLPAVRNLAWVRNPIDRFILARLEKEGLQPSPEADRYTLVRRVYLDLVGLPPTPAEADAFVRDRRPDAYERLVDGLLASPRYGERWARRWLDLARYADTNGYEKDRPRSIWPYRDWVIRALNADLPFNRFTIEQIAGDLLPTATLDQRIATGFHRNTMLNEEGGIDPLEFRFHAMTDRVSTTGTVWLGLTIGCAQCHTHKYDPLSQAEYYRFFAFLNNADEPDLAVPTATSLARQRQIEEQIARREAELASQFPVKDDPTKKDPRPLEVRRKEIVQKRFNLFLHEEALRTRRWQVLRPVRAESKIPRLSIQPDSSVLASGDQSKSDTYELTFRTPMKSITALRLEVLPDERLPRHGPGRVSYEGPPGDFFLSELTLLADGKRVALKEATHSFASGPNTAAKAIDGDPQTGWSINGGQGRAHQAVFRLATPLTECGELKLKLLCERYYAAGVGRFRVSISDDARPSVARDLPAEIETLLLIDSAKRTPAQNQQLFRQFLLSTPELAKSRAPLDALRRELAGAHPTTLVLAERPPENPRPTFLHHRGEFLQASEKVQPGVPAVLHSFPASTALNRLEFARWLVSPRNPLVGRVTVNRHWAVLFGRGIVPTVGDFGLQGEAPSHPELLDWLALEFVETGWSIKRLHRLIVTSAVYRQSSRGSAALLARDPDNRLLARGPRTRLEAEQVRDLVLRASELLAERLGGPSVFPPQPASVTTEGTYGQLAWRVSPGLDRYRRGLYTFSKRTAPFAMFNTFDAPSGEICVARRESSNTPLQALTLLNDQAIWEAAQHLGGRLAADSGSVLERARSLFRRILVRPPTSAEEAMIVKFFETQKKRFGANPSDAAAIAGPGAGEAAERAAWAALARVLFNLDETIVKG
jgi:hypothetical protein